MLTIVIIWKNVVTLPKALGAIFRSPVTTCIIIEPRIMRASLDITIIGTYGGSLNSAGMLPASERQIYLDSR